MLDRLLTFLRRHGRPEEPSLWFDAHCHVFNAEYLVLEASSMLFDMLRGRYPFEATAMETRLLSGRGGQADRYGFSGGEAGEAIKKFLAWAVELIDVSLDSEESNAEFIMRTGKSAFSRQDYALVPLMMDIYYMQAEALYPPGAERSRRPAVEALTATAGPLGSEERAEDEAERALAAFRDDLSSTLDGYQDRLAKLGSWLEEAHGRARQALGLDELVEAIGDRVAEKVGKLDEERYAGLHLTPGFRRQLSAVSALGEKYRGCVFPFFALDPRRPGAVDAVLSGRVAGRDGPFYGVKLYPRLGYHPACAELQGIYRYCADNAIPVTSHASYKGFPDWAMDYADFGNPAHWEPIVKAYPALKLDLAHFGARTDDASWHETIARLIRQNKNVYSDLSCYTREEELDFIARTYLVDKRIRSRVMFGSDFDVMYFVNPGDITLPSYYGMFRDRLDPETLRVMSTEAPKAFLFGK